MKHNSKIGGNKIDTALEILRITKKDLENIFRDSLVIDKRVLCSMGPDDPYWSSYYGTISIQDF